MDELTKAALAADPSATFHCQCCNRKLNPETAVWLELNCYTGAWARPGEASWTDGDQSQGCFVHGRKCAAKRLAGGC